MTIAGRTYLQIQEEVLAFQFSSEKYRPLVKTWINDGQRKAVIQSESRTQEAEAKYTTVSSVAKLAMPTDFSRFISLYAPEIALLDPLSVEELETLPPATGRPTAYVVIGDEINLYPTPDAPYELRLRYWRLPEDMVEDADEPEIAPQYHDVLVAYAMQRAYARENDYAAANFWKGEWEAGIAKMRGEVQADTFDGPQQVQGTYGDPHGLTNFNVWR